MSQSSSAVLVVDDNESNRTLLSMRLKRQGHTVVTAVDGCDALSQLRARSFDLLLLDIMMPELNGYDVLEQIKADPALCHIPVLVISAINEIDSVVRCIELGADDYLPKPFNPVLLKARVDACLEKKRLRDREQAYIAQLRVEREKSERLLASILPLSIAERLKQEPRTIAESFAEVTVLFADIVNFTRLSAYLSPVELVEMLNDIFSTFDHLAEYYGLEKIKTIGDAYMVVGGLPEPRSDHAEAVIQMAIAMQRAITRFNTGHSDIPLQMRIGISTGPVVAGVIGARKFSYDLWGETVNAASRMESHGVSGCIQVTEATYQRIRGMYRSTERLIEVKGMGLMRTHLLLDDVETEPTSAAAAGYFSGKQLLREVPA